MNDIPNDYKLEWDKLIHQLKPIVKRMYTIMRTLPTPCDGANIDYHNFTITIKQKEITSLKLPQTKELQ